MVSHGQKNSQLGPRSQVPVIVKITKATINAVNREIDAARVEPVIRRVKKNHIMRAA